LRKHDDQILNRIFGEKEFLLEENFKSNNYLFDLREFLKTHPCESARKIWSANYLTKSNTLGQMTTIWEVKEADADTEVVSFGTSSLNALKTSYQHDTLNNLITVNQGVQTRSFAYDSLSRLKQANNPESGIINYVYDNNGNLTSKTDARSVVTNYGYDNLNRVKTRSYPTPNPLPANYQATPDVAYTYDNLPNAKGKLIKVNTSVSTTEYTSFDILGRVQNHKQTSDGNTYNSSYVYNLSGALIEETYPAGRVVKNTLDVDGDLAMVQSSKSNVQGLKLYANAFIYTSAGAVSSLRLGNGKFENTTFNSRLQPILIGLGSSATSQNLLKLNFDYGVADNNGNVKSQTITVPTEIRNNVTYNGFTATQNYTYDSLNRLKSAVETIPNQTGWKQTFLFDRYGNRTFDTTNGNTTTLANGCPVAICKPTANPQNNKLVGTNYDSVGNTSQDANGQTFVYDAENKQVQVNNANGIVGKYWYNGDGQRVKKYVPSAQETTIFVYDASNKLVAEYSTITASPTEAKISYLTNDHLGSPRITTDGNGQVVSRRDFMPFGEEIQRANYGNDLVRAKFTGKERDGETNLDYFGARYYSNTLGRFTSVDPVNLTPERLLDPQRINLYVYTRNNPLKYTDPTGKDLKLDPKLKPADADRIIKAIAEAYRRESGRAAINKLDESKLPVIFTNGVIPANEGKFGRTELAALEAKEIKTLDDIKPQSVTITLDFAAIDGSKGEVNDLGVTSNELFHGQDAVDKFIPAYLVAQGAYGEEAIKMKDLLSDKFQQTVEAEKPTMTLAESETEVRKLFGLPAQQTTNPKPPQTPTTLTPTTQPKPAEAVKPEEKKIKP
jgi:RHS repeat-associated protein